MKHWRQWLTSLFPSPRRPFRWRDTWPLAVFLVVFGAVCFGLEMARMLMFARPMMLGLIVFAPWIWWMQFAGYAGLPKMRGTIAMFVRLCLLGLLVMVLAEPRAIRTRNVMSVVFALDYSDSIYNPDDGLKYVTQTVQTQRPKGTEDQAGLIIFGKTPACELSPSANYTFEAINSQVNRGATNIEQTLTYASALLPEENQGKIVLISDGVQTEGSLARVLDDLRSRGTTVEVLPIDYSYKSEVWLERLDLPQAVKLGESYEAGILVKSLNDGKGKIVLRENDKVIAEQQIDYKEGTNRFTVPITLRSAGYYEYKATIEVDKELDKLSKNNTVMNYILVEGEGKLLLVTDGSGDSRDWEKLEKLIREGDRLVERITGDELPDDATRLMPYDCIVFVNVPHDNFDAKKLQAVRDAVYNLGVGFMMVGGANSFGPGGYHRTVIEDILPVTMDVSQKKVLPKGALAIILHTCEFPEGNTWGKRITKQAIKVLGSQDEVGVLAYTETGERWLFELTPAGKYEELVPLINGASIGDMPSFENTMQLGLKGLMKSDAATRHMIIISDGDPQPPTPRLIKDFIDSKVSVSMVAIFPHGGMEQSKMQSIAEVTGGRYYYPDDPSQLPAIFIKESKTLKRSMLQNKVFIPEVAFPSPILKGIDGFPELKGYVITTAKEHPSMKILAAPPDAEDADSQDPILAVWQHGLGKTAAFTSDFSTNWGEKWQKWDRFQSFVKQLLTDISRVKKDGHLRMSTHTSGGDAIVVVEDFHPDESFLEVNAKLTGPNHPSETIQLKQVAPRRYQARVPLWGDGRYHIIAQGTGGDRKDLAFGGFIVPYSPEYLRFRANVQTLQEIAERTGGRVLKGDPETDQIYKVGRAPKRSSKPIFDWLLIALAILIPLDVAIRRIQIDLASIKAALGLGRKVATSATMGALLQAKQSATAAIESRRSDRPLPPQGAGKTPVRTSTTKSTTVVRQKPAAPAPQPDSNSPQSTTERLLALKRKRDEQK